MQILIGSNYKDTIIPLLDHARTGIDIAMYHWGFYSVVSKSEVQKINYAIKSAIHRGVPVRCLLHCGSPSDGLFRKNSDTANRLRSWGANVKFYKRSLTMHAKFVLIDRNFAIIGSHNYSRQSMKSNIEVSVMVDGSGNIRPLQEYFNLLWRQT